MTDVELAKRMKAINNGAIDSDFCEWMDTLTTNEYMGMISVLEDKGMLKEYRIVRSSLST